MSPELEVSCVLISPWVVFSFLGIDLVVGLLLYVYSRKNPRISSSARLEDVVGNLVIKTIKKLITLLLLMLRLTF